MKVKIYLVWQVDPYSQDLLISVTGDEKIAKEIVLTRRRTRIQEKWVTAVETCDS